MKTWRVYPDGFTCEHTNIPLNRGCEYSLIEAMSAREAYALAAIKGLV